MWPKRKIRLVAPPEAPGLKGLECLLTLLGIEANVVAPEQASDYQSSVWEFKDTLPTEVVFWTGTYQDKRVAKILSHGIEVYELGEFLKKLWQSEHIIALSYQTPMLKGQPLAFELLKQAELHPSLLWPVSSDEWQGILDDGLAWVVPLEWLADLGVADLGSPQSNTLGYASAHCVVRDTQIDFYASPDGYNYLGSITRFEDPLQEEAACEAVVRVLGEGVPWKLVSDSLAPVKYQWIRWNNDGLGDAAGESSQELSSGQSQYLENRRAG